MEDEISYESVYKKYYQDESTNSYYINDSSSASMRALNDWWTENSLKEGSKARNFWQDVLDKKIKIKKNLHQDLWANLAKKII